MSLLLVLCSLRHLVFCIFDLLLEFLVPEIPEENFQRSLLQTLGKNPEKLLAWGDACEPTFHHLSSTTPSSVKQGWYHVLHWECEWGILSPRLRSTKICVWLCVHVVTYDTMFLNMVTWTHTTFETDVITWEHLVCVWCHGALFRSKHVVKPPAISTSSLFLSAKHPRFH